EFWLREVPSFPWKRPFTSVFRQSPPPCSDQSLLFAMQNAKLQPESAALLLHTTTCFYFARGLCDRGASCTYAHSASDLRPKPDLSRTSLCRTLMKAGLCTAGEECMYVHGRAKLRRPRKKQTAARRTISGKQPAEHQDMSVPDCEPVTVKESRRRSYDDIAGSMGPRASSCSTFGDSNLEPSEPFGNATGSEASGPCSAGWDVDSADFETAQGNNLELLVRIALDALSRP
ncbi:unnamed protein product, partial [Polarella glacialis]